MLRRSFFGRAAAGVLAVVGVGRASSGGSDTTTTNWTSEPEESQDRSVRVGAVHGVELRYSRYQRQHGPWIGWLEELNGQCFGFVDDKRQIWRLIHAGKNHQNIRRLPKHYLMSHRPIGLHIGEIVA